MNNVTDEQHAVNLSHWPNQTNVIWEYFITKHHITRAQFQRFTIDIVVANLHGKTFENSTPSNVSPQDLAQSMIQMYSNQLVVAKEEVDRQALRRIEGLLYFIIKEQNGSTGFSYTGPVNALATRVYDKANSEGETLQADRALKANNRSAKVTLNGAPEPKNTVTGLLADAENLKTHLMAVLSINKLDFLLHGMPTWGHPVIAPNSTETKLGLAYLQILCENSEKQELTRDAMRQTNPSSTLFFETYQDITHQKQGETFDEGQEKRQLRDAKKKKLENTHKLPNETIALLCSRINKESADIRNLGGDIDEYFIIRVLLQAAGGDTKFEQTIAIINTLHNKDSTVVLQNLN
jgi:hypothetical protein